jgi:5-methylthioadenosine/S-adenosylhomocysteine deaminase
MLLSAKYIFPITSEPIRDGALLVQNGRIADIGPLTVLKLRYPDEEVRDFGLSAIMPGLIDLHTRLEKTVLRGVVTDEPYPKWVLSILEQSQHLDVSDWYDSAILGGLDALSSGITTIADITSTGASYQAAQKLGLRGVFYREVSAMDKMRIDYAIHSAQRDIANWQEAADSDRITIGVAPAPVYLNHPEVFARVSKLAQAEHLPVAMRLAASKEEFNFVTRGSSMFSVDQLPESVRGYVEIPPWLPFGVTPVRYALNWGAFDSDNVLIVHAVHVTDEDIRKLRNRDVAIATCPSANAQLGMGVAPLGEFLRAGMRVGIGTDSPAATETVDMLEEMRFGLLLHRAANPKRFMDSATVLEMATLGGARALKLDNEIGSLDIGKRADIVAVNLSNTHKSHERNPIAAVVNTCSASDVLMTMVDGNVLYERDQWHVDIDVAKNIARVIAIRAKLKA